MAAVERPEETLFSRKFNAPVGFIGDLEGLTFDDLSRLSQAEIVMVQMPYPNGNLNKQMGKLRDIANTLHSYGKEVVALVTERSDLEKYKGERHLIKSSGVDAVFTGLGSDEETANKIEMIKSLRNKSLA